MLLALLFIVAEASLFSGQQLLGLCLLYTEPMALHFDRASWPIKRRRFQRRCKETGAEMQQQ